MEVCKKMQRQQNPEVRSANVSTLCNFEPNASINQPSPLSDQPMNAHCGLKTRLLAASLFGGQNDLVAQPAIFASQSEPLFQLCWCDPKFGAEAFCRMRN